MSSSAVPRLGQLKSEDTILFVCDVQERFREAITGYPAVIDATSRLVRAAPHLGFPVIVTEQYPERLGSTVSELQKDLPEGSTVVSKTKFSMLVPEVDGVLEGLGRKTALLVGIETHVCVLQTALDLLSRGYEVHLLTDAVSSRTLGDRATAIRRLATAGAILATSETVLFQLLGDTKHPGFKAVSAFFKEQKPEQLPPL